MPRLSAAQQQARSDFLQLVGDGRLDKPTEEGSALPNLSYTCADFFRLEQQTVFRNNWVFAGFAHKLARSGDMHLAMAPAMSLASPRRTCHVTLPSWASPVEDFAAAGSVSVNVVLMSSLSSHARRSRGWARAMNSTR